ncbi:hypothetical protein RB595_010551 [Gaeumannomyces hyphopodioides]
MTDLEESIRMARKVIDALAPDNPNRAMFLSYLGNRLADKHLRTGAMADLEEAIRIGREAVDATPSNHPNRAALLNNLGVRLNNRYSQTGAMENLEEAIQVGQKAVDATPSNHPDRAAWLNNLRGHLGDRYSRTGAMADLEEAIRIGRETVDATPSDHPNRAIFLNSLGVRLNDRSSRTGAMADLEEAIQIGQKAVDATLSDHPNRATLLNNLGIRLGDKYSRIGAMADLEKAIRVCREAVDSTPSDHQDRAMFLNNLGAHLGDKYLRTGAMANLEEAIRVCREAVDVTPLNHPDRAERLNNFGIRLGDKHLRTGVMADLEEAIGMCREAVDATPSNYPSRAGLLNNLGIRLGDKYFRTGAMADLEEAIRIGRKAVDATPSDHPSRAGLLNNLGNRLSDRYLRIGAMEDLEEAIRTGREAVDATPLNHPDRAGMLKNLGVRIRDGYSQTGTVASLEEARKCFVTALHHPASVVSVRIAAGRHLLSSPAILQDRQAYSIAETTIGLIPLLAPRSLRNSDKRHLLSVAVGLSSDAAAIALHTSKGPAAAIELLETGRGVIAGTLFEQSDLTALECEHPDLARSFIDLRDLLDASAPAGSLATAEHPTGAAEIEGNRRRDAGLQLSNLIETIRSKSNFERFLLSASKADMVEAARHGPIVVLNVSSYRCDALVIQQSDAGSGVRSGIRLLELPHLSRDALNNRARKLKTLDTLGWLWDAIVCPILNFLGFTGPLSESQWPHVWWVPTGALTRFPLHAAGHHLRRTGETAVDRVVSSYASSVKAIIHSRRRPHQAPAAGEFQNAVVVAMQNTPKQQRLEHANDEINAVVTICESMGLPPNRPRPYKADVSSALKACRVFHFAGHGSTHPTEPLQSQLLLDDWDLEPFTVANLLETNLTSKPPFLAYLSACGTGQILDEASVDESIHLASAYQLAGFRHVVGTLWSVDDRLCVGMARIMYGFLRDEGMEDKSVRRGLHRATRMLRDQWVDGEDSGGGAERGAELEHGLEAKQPLWVPYVHFGV